MSEEKLQLAEVNKRVDRILNENGQISDHFKVLVSDSFALMFQMLGQKNFERWLDKHQFDDRLKKLIVLSLNKDEGEFKDNKNFAGYYTPGTNEVVLREDYNDINVLVHELFHFSTDYGQGFCRYIDEGLTEYLKHLSLPDRGISYRNNVKLVQFLHENIFGDKLIKSYLSGNVGELDDYFYDLINYDKKQSKHKVYEFYRHLDEIHEFLNTKQLVAIISNENAKHTLEEIDIATANYEKALNNVMAHKDQTIDVFSKLVIGKIAEKTRDMQFYNSNAKFDFVKAKKSIIDLSKKILEQTEVLNLTKEENEKFMDDTLRSSLDVMIENSHILVGKNDEEKLTFKNGLINQIISGKVVERDYIKEVESESTFAVSEKLIEKKLEANSKGVNKYVGTISEVLSNFELSNEEKESLLLKFNVKRYGNYTNFKGINDKIFSIMPKINTFEEIRKNRREETIESLFIKVDNNNYIEKRDNQYYHLSIDDKGDLKENKLLGLNTIYFDTKGFRVDINIDPKVAPPKVVIKKQNRDQEEKNNWNSIDNVESAIIVDEFSKDISTKINSGRYVEIEKDPRNWYKSVPGLIFTTDVDTSTRNIDFKDLIFDMKLLLDFTPESEKVPVIRSFTTEVLNKAFGTNIDELTPDNPNAEVIKKSYTTIINGVITQIATDRFSDSKLEEMTKAADSLSEIRKVRINKNLSTAAIQFRSEEERKMYEEKISEAQEKANQAVANDVVDEFDYSSHYERIGLIPVEDLECVIDGISLTQTFDQRDIDFDYVSFLADAKLSIIPVDKSLWIDTFNKIFVKQMGKTYNLYGMNKEKDPEVYEALSEINMLFRENLVNGGDIDDEVLEKDFGILNEYQKEIAKEGKMTALVRFEDDKTKQLFFMWNSFLELAKKQNMPEEDIRKRFYQITGKEKGIIKGYEPKGFDDPEKDA